MRRHVKNLYKSDFSGTMTRSNHSRSRIECPGRSVVVIAKSRLSDHPATRNRKSACPKRVSAGASESTIAKRSLMTPFIGRPAPTAGRIGKKTIQIISGNIVGKMKLSANGTGRNSGSGIASGGCR